MEFSKINYSERKVNQTENLPSTFFLWAAFGSIVASATLKCLGKSNFAIVAGQWAVPFLIIGIYNKIAKAESNNATYTTLWSE